MPTDVLPPTRGFGPWTGHAPVGAYCVKRCCAWGLCREQLPRPSQWRFAVDNCSDVATATGKLPHFPSLPRTRPCGHLGLRQPRPGRSLQGRREQAHEFPAVLTGRQAFMDGDTVTEEARPPGQGRSQQARGCEMGEGGKLSPKGEQTPGGPGGGNWI